MYNFNLKNKIVIVIILFLTVFIFSNKTLAQTSTCTTSSTASCFTINNVVTTDKTASIYISFFHKNTYDNLFGTGITLTADLSLISDTNHTTTNEAKTQIPSTIPMQNTGVAFGQGFGNTPDVNLIPNTRYFVTLKLHDDKNSFQDTVSYTSFVTNKAGVIAPTSTTVALSVNLNNGITTDQTQNVNPLSPSDIAKTKYTLLQQLPDGTGGNLSVFDSNQANSFGNYLNTIIRLFIGICAVLAMVMIVMGGIEYMTSELSHNKEEGKERITNAIFGLVIALGSFAILNTINPQLLDVSLSGIQNATVESVPTGGDFSPANGPVPGGAIGSCSEGITNPAISTAGGSFLVCNRIANNIQAMINKAWSEGYQISGWGWRSYAQQVALRIKNGCPDVYTSPPNTCKIPTAIPGTSMHESGLAVDLTCEGIGIQTHDNKCFIWLQKNATVSFGLKNLSSEPWHWSTSGY